MPKQSGNHRATPITPKLVAEIEEGLAAGTAVAVIATRTLVPETVVAAIKEDRSRPPAPQMPRMIHRTRRPKRPARPTKKHGPDVPVAQLEDGEMRLSRPYFCSCGHWIEVTPCRICKARRRRMMRRGGG